GESCTIHPHKGGEGVPNPPMPPAHNPTGCYRREFTLPENFAGRRVYLSFEGVETAYYLWVNGNPVGYSEDSKLPSEFEITPYLQKGENLFALQVMRFSTATYEEDQDYWYLSGIYRNVWLLAKPQIAIEDYKITAIPDLHQGTGTVSADITVTRKDGFADFLVQLQVFDGDRLLAEGQGEIMPIAWYRTQERPSGNTGRVTLKLDRAELWSPDSPKLYRGVITLLAPDGGKADVESCRFGFKTVEVKNGVVLLNGERLLVRGVNRHEHYPMGRSVPKAHMIEEIRQMKRMNINSVRTCHYPDSPLWYDLCDEYGILLVCECNLETHGVEGLLSHNPDYAASYVERGVRMVKTHKNHVSIYSWSLGNESGFGGNHAAMYGFIKEYDHTRLCQYEAGEPEKNISDIRGNM
ncbi:MAG: glycoside hydrolase family 2 TIM barrel-domain containing protein, partial [Oscillospiraceae bacterium]